jgi:periplasmic divalent cation tolerance protein
MPKKQTTDVAVVLVTAPDVPSARRLARAAVKARLAACANLVPRLESIYWWQGKVESAAEVLVLFKTSRPRLAALEQFILKKHPYDTPEFLVVRVDQGSRRYLSWLEDSLQ